MKFEIIMQTDNLATRLSEPERKKLAFQLMEDVKKDEDSRAEWLDEAQKSLDLIDLVRKRKSTPWPGAANAIIPLTTQAVLTFTSRLFAEVTRDKYPVKPAIAGLDPEGSKKQVADKIKEHMTYQMLMTKNSHKHMKALYLSCYYFAAVGTDAVYIYWDEVEKSPCYKVLAPSDYCVNADYPESPIPCFTMYDTLTGNRIQQKINMDEFVDYDFKKEKDSKDNVGVSPALMRDYVFYKRGCLLDLDEDGYAEPYIATIDKENCEVVELKKNFVVKIVEEEGNFGLMTSTSPHVEFDDAGKIKKVKYLEPLNYISLSKMFQWKDSNVYGRGLGQILLNPNAVANTLVRQMLDIGTLQARQGGFIDAKCRLPGGHTTIRMNELTKVNAPSGARIADSIMPYPRSEVSPVQMQLLQFIVDTAKEIANITEIMAGEIPDNTGAVMGMSAVQNSLVNFKTAYKMFLYALSERYQLWAKQNSIYMKPEDFVTLNNQQINITPEDYSDDQLTVVPNADPTVASDSERMMQQMVLDSEKDNPYVNVREVTLRKFEMINLEQIERFVPPLPDEPPPDQNAELTKAQISFLDSEQQINWSKEKRAWHELAVKEKEAEAAILTAKQDLALKADEISSKVLVNQSTAIKNMAQAEAAEAGSQIDSYMAKVKAVSEIAKTGAKLDPKREAKEKLVPKMENIDEKARQALSGSIDGSAQPGALTEGAPDLSENITVSPSQGTGVPRVPKGQHLFTERCGRSAGDR